MWSSVERGGANLTLPTESGSGVEVGAVFLGTHMPRLDDKGRLFLPAKFRDELAEGIVVTKGQERCLFVFPAAEFLRRAEELEAVPQTTPQARANARQFFASAFDQVPDRQGRISVPAELREYAGLDRDCAVVGAGRRVEIWDAARWRGYQSDSEEEFAGLSEGAVPGLP